MEMKVNRELIKQLRTKKFWTQENLAEESGVHPRTIQRIERDGSASLQSCVAICKALEIEPALLETIQGKNNLAPIVRLAQSILIFAILTVLTVALADIARQIFYDELFNLSSFGESADIRGLMIGACSFFVALAVARVAPTSGVYALITAALLLFLLPVLDVSAGRYASVGTSPSPIGLFALKTGLLYALPFMLGCIVIKLQLQRGATTHT